MKLLGWLIFYAVLAFLLVWIALSWNAYLDRCALASEDRRIADTETEPDNQCDDWRVGLPDTDSQDTTSLVRISKRELVIDTENLDNHKIGVSVEYPYEAEVTEDGDMDFSKDDVLLFSSDTPYMTDPNESETTILNVELKEDGTFTIIRKVVQLGRLNLGPLPTSIYKDVYKAMEGKIVLDRTEKGTWRHRAIIPEGYEFDKETQDVPEQ